MKFWFRLAALVAGWPLFCPADLLIKDVTVVDVITGAELPKRNVLIRGEQIRSVSTTTPAPSQVPVLNGAGKYLIPGLWDMHVHLWYRDNQFPLFLINGVTGLRDMGSDLNWVNQWRDQIKDGKLLGPRIETCGPPVDGVPSGDSKLPVFVVHNAIEARSTFDRLDNLDVDFIKILSGVPRDAYFALIERARKYYSPVAGHVPPSVSVMEAIDARQKSIEHLSGVLLACSSQEDRLRRRLLVAIDHHDIHALHDIRAQSLDTFDAKKSSELFERMARFETRQVPTLVMLRRVSGLDGDGRTADTHLPLIAPAIRKTWTGEDADPPKLTDEELAFRNAEFAKACDLIQRMKRAGVAIMAGTDTGDPYTFPGYDLHRELELLVEAGLSPLDVLRSATIEPAKYFDAADMLGSVDAGKLADLVVLDADPLKDIRNTEKIEAVLVAGKYLSRERLKAMTAALKVRK
jgi:hypothetical protein